MSEQVDDIIRNAMDVDKTLYGHESLEQLCPGNVGRSLLRGELEDTFGINISYEEFRKVRDVADVRELIAEKQSLRPQPYTEFRLILS